MVTNEKIYGTREMKIGNMMKESKKSSAGKTTGSDRWQDIEKLLQEGNNLCIKPQGYSMYPLFVPGRDEAIIEPVVQTQDEVDATSAVKSLKEGTTSKGKKSAERVKTTKELRRGDVVLYRRDKSAENGGILVLHRIWKVKEEGFYLVGDNQKEIEGPLRPDQMKGIMAGMNRKGKYLPGTTVGYRLYAGVWLMLRPFRPAISKTAAVIKRNIARKKK